MKATKTVEKKEVTKTIVEIVETPTFTLTLSAEEASLLRTSAYCIARGGSKKGSQVSELYANVYDALVTGGAKPGSVSVIEKQVNRFPRS